MRLTAQEARLLHLSAQGLLARPRGNATKASVLAAIERMRLLQIDTIHVVARSPYLVLFSRLGAYEPRWLDELLEEGAIFECWAHEACFAPRADYPAHRRFIEARGHHWSMRHAHRMSAEHRRGMDALLEEVRRAGPVRAADFEAKVKRKAGWWGWKDEKRWLEAWFALGELMIARRDRFQRVYDLRERVLSRVWPGWNDGALPSEHEMRRTFLLHAVRALGVAQARWLADYHRTGKKHKDAELEALVEEGALVRAEVKGWDAPAYLDPDTDALRRSMGRRLRATHTTLLSPFDPVIWDRARASVMFGFDYRIECYTPAPKRRYGYYVLPILDRGRLVGRLDAKAHRAEGRFEVKALFLEEGVAPSDALARRIARAIRDCAEWHGTPEVLIRRCEPRAFAAALRGALRPRAPRP